MTLANDQWQEALVQLANSGLTVTNANANGQALSSASSPVVPASDYVAPIKGIFTEPTVVTASALNADLVPAFDASGSKSGSIQILSLASGGVISIQQSNDNVNFITTSTYNMNNVASAAVALTISATGIFSFPVVARYVRIRQTSWSSGSTTGVCEMFSLPFAFPATVQQQGNFTLAPQTANGTTLFHLISAATTNATNLKASVGQIYGWDISNTNAAWRYVKVHNNAGTPTAGAGVLKTIGVPPGGKAFYHSTVGIPFSTGIAITTTTGITDADTTAVGASDLSIDIDFR